VLFGELTAAEAGPVRVLVPAAASLDIAAAMIFLLAATALLRFHLGIPRILALCAGLGIAVQFAQSGL
jgi:hypothetical protein